MSNLNSPTEPANAASARKRRLFEVLGVGAILFIGLYLVFSEARGHFRTRLPGQADSRLLLNILLWDVEAFQSGKSWHELWQMPVLYPEANMLATTENMLAEAAIFAPIYWVTGQEILSFNIMLALIIILDFLCAYLVASRLIGSKIGALFSAVLFTFGSFRLYEIVHVQMWVHFPTPVIFLAMIRIAEKPGWGWPLVGGLCLALQFYLGMYLGYFAAIMLGMMLLTLAAHTPKILGDIRFLSRLAFTGIGAGLLLLPIAGPYHEAAERWGHAEWGSTMTPYFPTWHNFFTPVLDGDGTPLSLCIAVVRATYWGYLPWIFYGVATVAVVQEARRRPGAATFWAICCIVMVPAICCLCVNHFRSYKFLFFWLPGFSSLRVPGRLALLALWPCGLLAGWGLAWLGQLVLPSTPRRRTILSLGVVALMFLENYHGMGTWLQGWVDVRCPRQEFYSKVVGNLPPGAIATLPFTSDAGEPYDVAGSIAAGWRPTLSVYTGRVPAWLPTYRVRAIMVSNSEQAAGLMGEINLRGIRFLILDKTQYSGEQMRYWRLARRSDGQPCGQTAYEDTQNLIMDLGDRRFEARLPLDWASTSAKAKDVCRGLSNAGDGYLTGPGAVTFEPTVPLRPGNYEASFIIEAENATEVICEINRIFLDNRWPPQPDWLRLPITLAKAPLQGQAPSLKFNVPEEKGPEPILQFRVVHPGQGKLHVHGVCIRAAE